MTFFEWFGRIAETLIIIWIGGATGMIIGNRAGYGLEMAWLVYVFWGVVIGSICGFFAALWIVWGVNFFPFLENM